MFTSKFCADFAMQNSSKVQNTHPDMSVLVQINRTFYLKEQCNAKTTPAFDENPQISKYAAWQTQYLGEILNFKRQMFVKHYKLYM